MPALSEITEQLLRRARIAPGMRVLDIGCGSGEVTRAVADIVGPSGSVVGVDASATALAAAAMAAESAAEAMRYGDASYLLGDLSELDPELCEFDCVVARRNTPPGIGQLAGPSSLMGAQP